MEIDFAELASLTALLKEADFSEFRYEKGDLRIIVRRGSDSAAADEAPVRSSIAAATPPVTPAAPVAAAPAAPAAAAPKAIAVTPQSVAGALPVKAPMLGTFYASPKPGEPAFVKIGDRVEPDTVLCIVEVMKLMNSVHAGVRGVVVGVHADNGDLVEFGQTLFSIQQEAA